MSVTKEKFDELATKHVSQQLYIEADWLPHGKELRLNCMNGKEWYVELYNRMTGDVEETYYGTFLQCNVYCDTGDIDKAEGTDEL